MARYEKSGPHQGREAKARQVALTSVLPLLRGNAPSAPEIRSAIACLYNAAAYVERSEFYAHHIAKDCLSHGHRLDLLRATTVLAFENASVNIVWDAAEYLLAPLLTGLCEGQRESGNNIGTGMGPSDGCDLLRDLARDEGEPLSRIIVAIERQCPQMLYGHPESFND